MTIIPPTTGALLPTLVRTPDELTAANVVSSWIDPFREAHRPAKFFLAFFLATDFR